MKSCFWTLHFTQQRKGKTISSKCIVKKKKKKKCSNCWEQRLLLLEIPHKTCLRKSGFRKYVSVSQLWTCIHSYVRVMTSLTFNLELIYSFSNLVVTAACLSLYILFKDLYYRDDLCICCVFWWLRILVNSFSRRCERQENIGIEFTAASTWIEDMVLSWNIFWVELDCIYVLLTWLTAVQALFVSCDNVDQFLFFKTRVKKVLKVQLDVMEYKVL